MARQLQHDIPISVHMVHDLALKAATDGCSAVVGMACWWTACYSKQVVQNA